MRTWLSHKSFRTAIDIDFMLGILYGLAYQQRFNSNEQFENIYNLRAQEIAAEQARQLANNYTNALANSQQSSGNLLASILGGQNVGARR